MKPVISSLLALALVCACSKSSDTYASGNSSHPTTSPTAKAPASSAPSSTAKTPPAHPNATDTSNAKADVDLQALIRKSIVGDDALSTSAKNVVIVVKGGDVTLRGTVPTADEKTRIGTLATNVAGVTNVDNQIEVKP